MLKKLMAGILLVTIPICLSANIIDISAEGFTVEEAIFLAADNDTIIVSDPAEAEVVASSNKDLTAALDEIEPPDAEPDSTIYGPNNPFPPSPVEE